MGDIAIRGLIVIEREAQEILRAVNGTKKNPVSKTQPDCANIFFETYGSVLAE